MPTNRTFRSIVSNWTPDQFRDLEEQYQLMRRAVPESDKRAEILNESLVIASGKAFDRHKSLIDHLVSFGAKPSDCPDALAAALQSEDLEMAAYLARIGCSIHAIDTDIIYPICFDASSSNNPAMLGYLLTADERIDVQIRSECLELASKAGSFEAVRALLPFGFSKEKMNQAAHVAAENDHLKVVVLLTWHGADPLQLPGDWVAEYGLC